MDGVDPARVPSTFNWLKVCSVLAVVPFMVRAPKMVLVLPPWMPSAVLPAAMVTGPMALLPTEACRMPLVAKFTAFWTKTLVAPLR